MDSWYGEARVFILLLQIVQKAYSLLKYANLKHNTDVEYLQFPNQATVIIKLKVALFESS